METESTDRKSHIAHRAPLVPAVPSELRTMMREAIAERDHIMKVTDDTEEADRLRIDAEKIKTLLTAIEGVNDNEKSQRLVTLFLNTRLAFKDIITRDERREIASEFNRMSSQNSHAAA